jgi:hypothetical protein
VVEGGLVAAVAAVAVQKEEPAILEAPHTEYNIPRTHMSVKWELTVTVPAALQEVEAAEDQRLLLTAAQEVLQPARATASAVGQGQLSFLPRAESPDEK